MAVADLVDGPLLAMLDALPERIARFDRDDLVVRYCNVVKAAEYGLTPDELIGRPLSDVLDEGTLSELQAHLAQLGENRSVLTSIAEVPGPYGTSRCVEWIDQLHPDAHGNEVLSVGRDVTVREYARRQLHESEERFRLAMTDAPIGMALVGTDFRFLEVNEALCVLLGRSEEELLAMTTLDVTHPDDVINDVNYGQAVMDGLTGPGLQKRFLRPDGSVIHGLLKVSAVRTSSGQPSYVIGQLVDITDQVAHQDHLRRAAEAERAAAERLRRLDDLLDVDRLARGRLTVDREHVDVAAILRSLVGDSSVVDRVRVTAPEQLWAQADVVQFGRIVSNLLDNAGKYAPSGVVEVRLAAVGGAGFRLDVIDEGPGIAADELQDVFEPFYRSDEQHPQPGTGVGLALVAEFARLHGGKAWAERTTSGAHLVVEIPEVAAEPDAR